MTTTFALPSVVPTAFGDIAFTSEQPVEVIQTWGSDRLVVGAAQASTGKDLAHKDASEERVAGLIGYLARSRHGSPFEHSGMTFAVDAPIFVFREFMRHRIASYSEMSARYVEMLPRFYSYPEGRPLVQAGSSAHPDLVDGDEDLHRLVTTSTVTATVTAWEEYQRMLTAGAAREVARAVLPVSTFSRMWVSVNLRSLMNFLSLRVDGKDAALFETKPQWEIEQVARAMEEHFAAAFPHTHAAFVASKRVSP